MFMFVDTGAWMDGWETKRHNPNYDWYVQIVWDMF